MAPLKVYVATITANPEIRKRVQRTLMLLEGLGIPFDTIDITKPGNDQHRVWMREHAVREGDAPSKQPPLPPQFFYEDDYLGNFLDFDESVEADKICEFLRLTPNNQPSTAVDEEEAEDDQGEKVITGKTEEVGEEEEAELEDEAEEAQGEEEAEEEEEGEEEEGEEEGEDEEEVAETAVITLAPPPKKAEEKKEDEAVDEEEYSYEEEEEDEEYDEDEEYEEEEEGEE